MKSHSPECSRCIRSTLELSHRTGWLDDWMKRLGFRPMHCRSCSHRVYIRTSVIRAMNAK